MSVTAIGNLAATESFAMSGSGSNTTRLASAAKEFESVLLGQWLKDAESSFGTVPGSDEDDDAGQQMKDFAMQHVATEITDRGGIGIAPMVQRALAKQEGQKVPQNGGQGR